MQYKKKRKKNGDEEIYYRAMKDAHYKTLETTDRMPPSNKETFISPTLEYVQSYEGIIVEFALEKGTTSALAAIGVRDESPLVKATYPDMRPIFSGWKKSRAFFKEEDGQINIGLGNGRALEIFNDGIVSFDKVAR
ncbi:hypothetical protein ACSDR0_31780 [Streptosporangium sp. G11]|uniref:hypothetical protein n=1 Tax=Streptosporangium sp. G11 TaxID=3436926 RepID=UPI003EBEFDDB